MEPASTTPRSALARMVRKVVRQIRLPAVTPRTPDPKSVGFQQFCDGLRTDLPGDSFGRVALRRGWTPALGGHF